MWCTGRDREIRMLMLSLGYLRMLYNIGARRCNTKTCFPWTKRISNSHQTGIGQKALIADRASNYRLVEGLLYRQNGDDKRKLAVPRSMVEYMLQMCHNTALGGH